MREFLADIEAVGVPKVAKDWPDLIVTYNMAKMFLSGVRPKVDAKPNTGLVWDDSRIQEAADVAYKAVIDFLESFADGPDAMLTGAVAHRVELLVRADLKRWAEGQDPLPFAFLQDIIHMPLNFEKVKNKSSTNALG